MGFRFLPESSVELHKVIRFMVRNQTTLLCHCKKRSTRDVEHIHLLGLMVEKSGLYMASFSLKSRIHIRSIIENLVVWVQIANSLKRNKMFVKTNVFRKGYILY